MAFLLPRRKAMLDQFVELGTELDKESYEWLVLNHPTVADALEIHVKRGATPDQLKAFVLRRCGANRTEFAIRCEAAGRHIIAGMRVAK
jgi:predicted outer membrane protein